MGDDTTPLTPADGSAPLDKTQRYDATLPLPESLTPPTKAVSDRLAAATRILHQLGPLAPGAAGAAMPQDVRTIDFLRAADEIVRPFGFEIVRLIGQGGMGAVFEGRDRKLDRGVAIKFILPQRMELFDGMVALLESEARALASINHENAVQVYAIHHQGNNLFIVMELVRGTSLAQVVANRGPMPEAQALRLIIQASRALAALHQQSILHRDIKPENILFSETGQAKLSDFGLALARHGKTLSGYASSAAGTPAYMSPEVFEGETPSARSDVYAMGMTLRFMLTGKRPALGDSLEEIRKAVIQGRVPALRTERPNVSADTEMIVAMALKRSADQRYQTAEALAAASEKALLRLGAVREQAPAPTVRVLLRRGGRIWAFLATLFVAGMVVGWWSFKVKMYGYRAFRMWNQQTGKAISDKALDLLDDQKKVPLVPVETAAATAGETQVRVIGVVSANRVLDARRNQFIVQDESGGALMDDPRRDGVINANLQPGDRVEIVGKGRLWEGILVVEVADYIEPLGKGAPPKAVPLTLEQVGPEWSGCRVLLKNLQWAEKQPPEADRARVSDGRGHEMNVRAGADASVLANRSAKPFDLLAIPLVTEVKGKPGQAGEIFLVALEIQPPR